MEPSKGHEPHLGGEAAVYPTHTVILYEVDDIRDWAAVYNIRH